MMSKEHVTSSKSRYLVPAREKFTGAQDTTLLLCLALSGGCVASGGSPKRAKFTRSESTTRGRRRRFDDHEHSEHHEHSWMDGICKLTATCESTSRLGLRIAAPRRFRERPYKPDIATP